jgi:D-sedoheptulose 7-phosphate isomerase
MQDWLEAYVMRQKAALDSIPLNEVKSVLGLLRRALHEDQQVFVMGNGGSAANASHFITDLGKGASDAVGRRFRCLSLNDNGPWMTAIGNDYAFEDVFVRQLENYGRAGDVAIGVSVSGNSPNLVKAFEWANQNGLETVGLVGGRRGRVGEIARHVLVINDTHYGRVEDAQMAILHMLCYAFIEHPEYAR